MTGLADAARAIEVAGKELVSFEQWNDASFLHLPLVYPSGSAVTVKINNRSHDLFRISDLGFAYRELESYGMQRSFASAADTVLAGWAVFRDARAVFADVHQDQLSQGIMDVARSSWQIVERVYARIREDHELEIQEYVADRLLEIFGKQAVSTDAVVVGASTSPWEITAIVNVRGKKTVFQAVSAHANSIYRTNAAFDDIAALDSPPVLVAVVESKALLGPKLTLLARQSAVIESGQSDSTYRRAAA
jgi:hypothetical protein